MLCDHRHPRTILAYTIVGDLVYNKWYLIDFTVLISTQKASTYTFYLDLLYKFYNFS